MIKKLVISLVLVLVFSSAVMAGDFREMNFGDSKEYLDEEYDMNFTRLEGAETDDMYDLYYGVRQYILDNEDASVGGYETGVIGYGFFSDELMTVLIDFKESASLEGIFDMFTERYGEAKVEENYREGEYTWVNNGTFVVLVYKENIFTDGFKFITASLIDIKRFTNLRAWQKEQQDKYAKEKAKEW